MSRRCDWPPSPLQRRSERDAAPPIARSIASYLSTCGWCHISTGHRSSWRNVPLYGLMCAVTLVRQRQPEADSSGPVLRLLLAVLAAALMGHCRVTGLEQRPSLVASARTLTRVFDLHDRVSFVEGALGVAPMPFAEA